MADSAILEFGDDLIRMQALAGDPLSWSVYYLGRDPYQLRRRIYDTIQSSRRNLVLVPMGHTKSSTVPETLVPMFACQYPDIRIGVVSEAADRAAYISEYARDQLEGNKRIIQDYGHLRGTHWTTTSWSRSGRSPGPHLSHPTCRAVGLATRFLGSRWDVIFADDLISQENSQTDYQQRKMNNWWFIKVLSRLDANRDKPWPWGGYFVVGNLMNPRDTYSEMILRAKAAGVTEGEYGLNVMKMAAYTDEARTVALLPELWSVAALQQAEDDMGSIAFEVVMMNNPSAMANLPFGEERFAYWTEDPTRVVQQPVRPVYRLPPRSKLIMLGGMDLGGEFKGNDYSAIAVCGYYRPREWYYWLDFTYGNWDPTTMLEKMLLAQAKWKLVRFNVESNAFQGRLAQVLAREHPKLLRIMHPTRTGTDKHKDQRIIDGLDPGFTRGAHIFPEEGHGPVMAMLQQYPGHRYKDLPDTMEITIRDLDQVKPRRRVGAGISITPPI